VRPLPGVGAAGVGVGAVVDDEQPLRKNGAQTNGRHRAEEKTTRITGSAETKDQSFLELQNGLTENS
jgi:hypothetical protein